MKKTTRGTPLLTTQRLTLDRLSMEDAESFYRGWMNNENVTRWMFLESGKTLEQCREFINDSLKRYDTDGNYHHWAIRKNSKCIGSIVLMIDERHHSGRVGYALEEEHWGKGYMLEVLRAVIDFAFSTLKLHRVEADHFAENGSSGRVMEKAGMKKEGIAREKFYKFQSYHDAVLYGIVKSDWKKG